MPRREAAPRLQARPDSGLHRLPGGDGAGLQVSPAASYPTIYPVGALRLLAAAFPDTQQASGHRRQQPRLAHPAGPAGPGGLPEAGLQGDDVQPRPALVDNYRPWMEQMKAVRREGRLRDHRPGPDADLQRHERHRLQAGVGAVRADLLLPEVGAGREGRVGTFRTATSTSPTCRSSWPTSSRSCSRRRTSWPPPQPTEASTPSRRWPSTPGRCGPSRRRPAEPT